MELRNTLPSVWLHSSSRSFPKHPGLRPGVSQSGKARPGWLEEAALTRVYQGTADKCIPIITRNVPPCPCCASPVHLPGPSALPRFSKHLPTSPGPETAPEHRGTPPSPHPSLFSLRSSLPALRNATAQTLGLLNLQTLLNLAVPQGSANRSRTTTSISPFLPLQENATKFSVPTSETGIL